MIPVLSSSDFTYELPRERIAEFPLPQRDQSKLLVCTPDEIREEVFCRISGLLPADAALCFNDTRVIHARLIFRKETGALIELFLLEPAGCEINEAMQQRGKSVWKCLAGNAKKWKSGLLTRTIHSGGDAFSVSAKLLERNEGNFIIEFSWDSEELSFTGLVEKFGLVPLPPYITREAEASDDERYQTVYARHDGSVAAPTAGLHFTPEVLAAISARNIPSLKLTLHVGAGTFKPMTAADVADHSMHSEEIIISREVLNRLIQLKGKKIIPVGTTSLRTLESLCWIARESAATGQLCRVLPQWYPYLSGMQDDFCPFESLRMLLEMMEAMQLQSYTARTALMVAPSYRFRFTSGLITNFHQPGSTLLLLVAALAGERWKEAYRFALANGFRFLSYGDSCLFLPWNFQ